MTLAGGDGDDDIRLVGVGEPVTITCGAGKDTGAGRRVTSSARAARRTWPASHPGPSRARSGRAASPRRRAARSRSGAASATRGGSREIIARGTFTAQPGALRVSLKPTAIGRRWLRRDPRLTVFVSVRTRDTAGERGEVSFQSRIR